MAKKTKSKAPAAPAGAAPDVDVLEAARLAASRDPGKLTPEQRAALDAVRPRQLEPWDAKTPCVAAELGHDACRCPKCEEGRRCPT